MYLIMGASGNTGKIIATQLLAAGKKVRVMGRSADKLAQFVQKGAEAVVGDDKDATFIQKAFAGVKAVYAMIPPNYTSPDFRSEQLAVGKNIVDAIKNNNLSHVVFLSSVGAHLPEKAGIVQALNHVEVSMRDQLPNTNIVTLRPSYFMENLFGQLNTIKHMGVMGSPIKGDMKLPMVATPDIAAAALQHLSELSFVGHSIHYLLGSRDISFNEVAQILGAAIGKPDLKYVEFPSDDARNAMIQGGLSASVAGLMVEFSESCNTGAVLSNYRRSPQSTTPTSIEQFVQILAGAYKAM